MDKIINNAILLQCDNGMVIMDKILYDGALSGNLKDNTISCNISIYPKWDVNYKVYLIEKGFEYFIRVERFKNDKDWEKNRYINGIFSDKVHTDKKNKIIGIDIWLSNIRPLTQEEYLLYMETDDE